jgi:hypothetical protein
MTPENQGFDLTRTVPFEVPIIIGDQVVDVQFDLPYNKRLVSNR